MGDYDYHSLNDLQHQTTPKKVRHAYFILCSIPLQIIHE